jgi:MoaA/NifB/PqqE/SkfB family radical SAM enzyme
MRGCNGHDKVLEVIETLKDEVPVSLMFCLSPWNTFEDMDYVIGLAKRYDVDVRIGIYGTMDFFDTTADLLSADMAHYIQNIPKSIHGTEENFDFVALYKEWRNGRLRLRCQSIFSELVIHSNGDVPLCQNLGVMLGNVYEHSLDEIFNSREATKVQCQYSRECNGCWINFQHLVMAITTPHGFVCFLVAIERDVQMARMIQSHCLYYLLRCETIRQ